MKRIKILLLSLLTATTWGFMACGGGDDEPVEPVTPPTPVTPTNPTEPTTPTVTTCEGWPADYGGVMLQGFYWDSYGDSKWAQLTEQADELSQYFDLIWVPNSGKTSDYYHTKRQTMGYDPCFWLDHNTCWGTEAELLKMVKTFKEKGTGFIEDVVINHKNGLTSWVDFPNETNGTYTITWDNQNYSAICRNDECNSNGYKTTGATDTGDNFDGYRDLDHTNAQVQLNVKTYLDYLVKEIGYVGFRYDMVKGFSAKYVGQYNVSAQPKFSVGECWDSNKTVVTNWINGTKQEGKIASAAFDFPMKYKLNNAFGSGTWAQLGQAMLANDVTYQRYAVTFVDNHDTYRENTRLRTNVCAANAYILCMPGTPCLFLKHWQSNKGTLKRLIALRKAAGITNQSEIVTAQSELSGFVLNVKGSKGSLLLVLGNAEMPTGEWQLALQGKNYKLYATNSVDLTKVKAVTDNDAEPEDDSPVAIPDFCTVADGEICAFFEAPTSWGNIKCWRWDNQYNYTTNQWPGVDCTLIGTTKKGKKVWKWTFNTADRRSQQSSNAGIIFNDGTNQTADLSFQNGGYYTEDGLQGIVSSK
jgi:alpha-amylase